MRNNSNQTALLIMSIVLGAFVSVFMYFDNDTDQQYMSSKFEKMYNSSANVVLGNKNFNNVEFSIANNRSDLSGVILPSYNPKNASGRNYAPTANPDFPSIEVNQVDVQNINLSTALISRSITKPSHTQNQIQSFGISNGVVQYSSNLQNKKISDFNPLPLLNTRAAENAMPKTQGAKRATPALKGKTTSTTADISKQSGAKKVDGAGDPGEIGLDVNLPAGDGVYIMFTLLGVYCVSRFVFRVNF